MAGATRWQDAGFEGDGLPGPEPVLFFAPTVAEERAAALGSTAFARRMGAAWSLFAPQVGELTEFRRETGADALAKAYVALLDGDLDPREGLVFDI